MIDLCKLTSILISRSGGAKDSLFGKYNTSKIDEWSNEILFMYEIIVGNVEKECALSRKWLKISTKCLILIVTEPRHQIKFLMTKNDKT